MSGPPLKDPSRLIGSDMIIERVVLVPYAAPRSKGDEGMLRGTLAFFQGFPISVVKPNPCSELTPGRSHA